MDWSKAKTIFIVVFLIVNAFLVYQYIEKKTSNDYEYFTESSIEEELKENEITYTTLPNQTIKAQDLNATSKQFTKDELGKLKNQTVSSFNDYKLLSKFDKAYLLGNLQHSEALDNFVKENVLYGEDYRFWKVDESTNSIIYYQVYDGRVIFDSSNNSKLTLFLNSDYEITSYEQTYLENFEEINEEKEVLQAIKAIQMLYKKGYIPSKSNITKVELGYYNLIQLTSSHVLRPVWHIVLNDEDFYVSAFEGQIIQADTITNNESNGEELNVDAF